MSREPAEFDIVVAGSGAVGMTAALTAAHLGLSVLIIEKAGFFGGSTARSGGGSGRRVTPGNMVLRDAGVTDTPEQARVYLAHGHDVRRHRRPHHGGRGRRPRRQFVGATPSRG